MTQIFGFDKQFIGCYTEAWAISLLQSLREALKEFLKDPLEEPFKEALKHALQALYVL